MRVRLYSIQGLPTGQISIMARPRGADWLSDEIADLREAGVDILVSLLTPAEVDELDLVEETACCQNQGLTFFSFPIPDLSVPPFSASTFTFLERLHTQILAGKHIVLHCRQGIGRSGLMAASLMTLSGFSPELACAHLSKIRGYAVPETEEQRAWIEAFYHRITP